MSLRIATLLALASFGMVAAPAFAAPTADAAGDFLPSFTGPQGGDLDVLSVEVLRSGTSLTFNSTLAAAVGTTPGGFYVWGIDRGQGTARFVAGTPSVGAGVLFDSVLVLRPDGAGNFVDLLNPANSFALAPGAISIAGSLISATVLLSAIPSTGFGFADYSYNLWPRAGGIAGSAAISDFAPDGSNILATAVPEPASWALLVTGFAGIGAVMRRRRPRLAR